MRFHRFWRETHFYWALPMGLVAVQACGSRSDLDQRRFGAGAEGSSQTAGGLDPDQPFSTLRPSDFTGNDPVRSSQSAGSTGDSDGDVRDNNDTQPRAPTFDATEPGTPPEPTPDQVQADGTSVEGSLAEEPGVVVACQENQLGLRAVFEQINQLHFAEPPQDQAFVRYVVSPTLRRGHCAGRAPSGDGLSDLSRDGLREQLATAKIINSVSRAADVHPVEGIVGLPWVLRLDLRDYQWEQPLEVSGRQFASAWEAIGAEASQLLQFEGSLADELADRMGTRTPFLLVGDFLDTVSRGELYYALVGAPNTIKSLREQLGILPSETFNTPAWMRSGISTSGVGKQPTSVARFMGAAAASGLIYWEQFSFEPASSFPGIYEDPLGNGADVKMAIYNLPNGLFAYFVSNGDGERIGQVPPSVDIDPAHNGGVVDNASSCFSCHNGGLIPFTDTVRSFVESNEGTAFSSAEVDAVQAVYFPVAEQNRIVEQDSERFLQALEASGLPRGSADSISRVFLSHQLGGLTRLAAAAELFTSPSTFTEQLAGLPRIMRIAGETRTVTRNQYDTAYLAAICSLQFSGANPMDQNLQVAGCP